MGKLYFWFLLVQSQCARQELLTYKSHFDHFVTWKLTKKAVLRCLEGVFGLRTNIYKYGITGIYADGWLVWLVEIQLRKI